MVIADTPVHRNTVSSATWHPCSMAEPGCVVERDALPPIVEYLWNRLQGRVLWRFRHRSLRSKEATSRVSKGEQRGDGRRKRTAALWSAEDESGRPFLLRSPSNICGTCHEGCYYCYDAFFHVPTRFCIELHVRIFDAYALIAAWHKPGFCNPKIACNVKDRPWQLRHKSAQSKCTGGLFLAFPSHTKKSQFPLLLRLFSPFLTASLYG